LATKKTTKKQHETVTETWNRYMDSKVRGHADFENRAKRNEDFYLGGGRQWTEEEKEALESMGKPWIEPNIVFSIINTVLGYQTQTRMDIAFKPREVDDQDLADMLSKISMYILDVNQYPWVESQVFADGIIMSRGFFDVRMNFDDNFYGEITVESRDPMDIVPDIDADTYDPDDWADVIECKWLTLDEIEELYGKSKRNEVERNLDNLNQEDFGWSEIGSTRNSFGDDISKGVRSYYQDEFNVVHARVLERQWWKIQVREFFVDTVNGETEPVPDEMSDREKNRVARENDYTIVKKASRRVRWTVVAQDTLLHDAWSPYDHFTIVPYFPYFRRGRTIGLVDNLISTQEAFNKVLSQTVHAVNSTSNSGWVVEENSLTNMDTEDLEDVGSMMGLILEYRSGREKPEKIEPNQIPTGLSDLSAQTMNLMTTISGVSDVFRGEQGPEITGTAIANRVQQNAVQLAAPLDNLFRTRHMIAERVLNLVQNFYTEERTFVITNVDEFGQEQPEQVVTNTYDEEMEDFVNDLSQGKYDVVITDVPNQVTFQNSQFQQALELRKFGVMIPDDVMVMYSGLSKKNELAKRLSQQPSEEESAAQQQQLQSEMAKAKAEVDKAKAEATNKRSDSLTELLEVAQIMQQSPEIAVTMQQLMNGIGFKGSLEEREEAGREVQQAPQQLGGPQGGFNQNR
jgi:hypothetical protein